MELVDERVTPGWLVVQEAKRKPTLRVRVRLGPIPPKVVGGYGGWELVRRPRRRSLTEWTGSDPVRVEVNFLFDRFDNRVGDQSVESQVAELEKLGGLLKDGTYPPRVWWECNGPHDHGVAPNVEWVIENIVWDEPLYNVYGNRTRQGGTLTFLMYVEEEYSKLSPSARHRNRNRNDETGKKKGDAGDKVYVVKRGDTLAKIAARELGKKSRWKEIAKLNNIRDPRKIQVGQRLKLP